MAGLPGWLGIWGIGQSGEQGADGAGVRGSAVGQAGLTVNGPVGRQVGWGGHLGCYIFSA